LTVEIVVLEHIFDSVYYRFLPFYACELNFCRSWTSESCITISIL